jgi:holdfast attachment protein HfaA
MAQPTRPLLNAAAAVLAVAAGLAFASAATAQTMNANSASFNAGFGRSPGEENRPVDVQMTDANGNMTMINGVAQAASGSIFNEVRGVVAASATASIGTGGAGESFSGAGNSSSASVIGNNLNVVVQGNNNTVIVNSTQTNTGALSATVSGKP